MATISSPGLGSGLDIARLVGDLVAAEAKPTTLRLDRREAALQADLSAYGTLRGALSSFSATLTKISSLTSFQARSAGSTDDKAVRATATSTAVTGTYNISVTQLARAHSLATPVGAFTSITDPVGTGILTFKFGATVHTEPDTYTSFTQNASEAIQTVTIDSTNDSLQGVRDAINAANIGVTATIINNGSGYRLVMTSGDTGANHSMQITADDDDLNDTNGSGLSILAFNASATNMIQTQAAQDAALSINNIAVTSDKNTLTEAIEGVTLTLLKDASSATVSVATDVNLVTKNIEAFVNGYNTLIGSVKQLTKFDPTGKSSGVLLGDTTTRAIESQINAILGAGVDQLTGPYSILADIGVTRNTDGTLKLDSSKLQTALDTNFDAVAGLFVAQGKPTDALVKFTGSTASTKIGSYSVGVTQLATRGVINGNGTGALADNGAGNFSTPFNVDVDNDAFKIKVDGIESDTITLTAGNYTTTASLAAEIQARINGDTNLENVGITVAVSFDAINNRLVFTSDRFGSASKLEFTEVDINTGAELGFTTALVATDGVDTAGSIGTLGASGSGRFLTGTGDATGLKLEVIGGDTGTRGNVTFTRGYADRLNTLIDEFLKGNGLLDTRVVGIQGTIDNIEEDRVALNRRLETLEARLFAQFNAMDTLVAQLSATSNFLTQQLAGLPGASRRSG
ncbi:MAG: flagellar hook-associated protein 2 [Gammaproteobacteria bacterium]|nr:MAG: flagellar hook-associated protein 2 [Gammaproteobacteria bacterium]TND06713.1 MAG: flagellar hook-associated protein 2 [Gammaproteobacteria bacterium]